MMKKLLFPLLFTTTLIAPNVLAGTFTDNIKFAMASETRTDKEKTETEIENQLKHLSFLALKKI